MPIIKYKDGNNNWVETNISSLLLPDAYIKDASVSENTLTLTKKDDTEIVFTPSGGSGGGANADEATIITNAEGKLETAIGGKWVDGLVDGPVIATVYGTGQDVSQYITYNVKPVVCE